MKSLLKSIIFITCCALIFASAASLEIRAQNNTPYTVSARAGGISYATGKVSVRQAGERDFQSLKTSDYLNSGDELSTGAMSRVEVLLSPGSFLRVSENSRVTFTNADLDSMRLKLMSGTIIVEASGEADEQQSLLEVRTPQTTVSIIKSGVYRISSTPDMGTVVAVRKGQAQVAGSPATTLKGNSQATISGASSTVTVAKLDKKNVTEFEVWSKERAEEVATNNRKLERKVLRSTLASYNTDDFFFGRGFGRGVWVRNSFTGALAFLPFYSGWSSPYGSSYRNYLWFNNPYGYYYPPRNTTPNPSGGGTTTRPTTTPHTRNRDMGNRTRSPQPQRQAPQAQPSRAPRDFPTRNGTINRRGGSSPIN